MLNVAMDSNKKYFFAPVLMADGSILYCNIGDKTAIVPDLEPDEPAWTQYKALSSLYVRTFPNTWCDTGVLKTLSKGTTLELDVMPQGGSVQAGRQAPELRVPPVHQRYADRPGFL